MQEFRRNGRSSRAWLWVSVSRDALYYLIDRSRNAEVAKSLFGDTACTVYVVCDRFSAYRKLARELGGKVILPWVEIPNLGSHILALMRRRLPGDWTPRNTGAVYRASGWIRVGTTQGRGRYDTRMKRAD